MPRAKVTEKAGNGNVTKKTTTPKATAKAAPKKTAAKTAAKKPATRKPATRKTRQSEIMISDDQRRHWIAEAAYLRAEARGFTGGDATRDWLEAENEVDARITAHA